MLKKGTFDYLLPETVKVKGVVRGRLEIILVGGSERDRFRIGYD